MECNKCHKREAEFDSPDNLCDICWAKWFTSNQPGDAVKLSKREQLQYFKEVLAEIRKDKE